jgi:alkanesulfonate monooxygenase SsuD/methylene tetrahydromethanopterin reductase-like flavin-dependent oxidoreductase (luciferase family)
MANLAPRAVPVVNLAGCRQAVRDWAAQRGCELFVTLVFNRATTERAALQALRDFHARVDRKLLGHNWCKRTGRRTAYVAVLENVETNLHIHLLTAAADGKAWDFCKAAVKAWARIAPAGNADITPASNPAAAADYMLKKIRLDTLDRVRFSGDH